MGSNHSALPDCPFVFHMFLAGYSSVFLVQLDGNISRGVQSSDWKTTKTPLKEIRCIIVDSEYKIQNRESEENLCRGFYDQRWFYESYDEGEVDCIVVTIERRRRRRRMRMLKDVCEAA